MGHLASIHGERIQCDFCEYQGYPKEKLVKHKVVHHNICQTCGKQFPNFLELEEHCVYVHEEKMPGIIPVPKNLNRPNIQPLVQSQTSMYFWILQPKLTKIMTEVKINKFLRIKT